MMHVWSQQQITIRLESQEASQKEPQKLTAWKFHKANNTACHSFPRSDFEAFSMTCQKISLWAKGKLLANGQESQIEMVSARHYSDCKRASTSVCCVEGGG
jgi:hypothetical protein